MTSTIKMVRVKLGLTQKQMSKLMGMTRGAVGAIEAGVGGRKETNIHAAHLVALETMEDAGCLDEFMARLDDLKIDM